MNFIQVFILRSLLAFLPIFLSAYDCPTLSKGINAWIKPHLLPLEHPLKEKLDFIFSGTRVTKNLETFKEAGFEILFLRPATYICIARHPLLPGYLIKAYLDNEQRKRNGFPSWVCLVNRCKGAKNIRKLIKKKQLQYFDVPDKWVYPLPHTTLEVQHPLLLLVKDMDLVENKKTKIAWKEANEANLKELYCILKHGYASTDLIHNIPLSYSGKFACIDTEYPKRQHKFSRARPCFSKSMQEYWNKLTSTSD